MEATLRFDTLRGKKDEPGRVPEMKSVPHEFVMLATCLERAYQVFVDT